jgi:hypothetical protein
MFHEQYEDLISQDTSETCCVYRVLLFFSIMLILSGPIIEFLRSYMFNMSSADSKIISINYLKQTIPNTRKSHSF